MSFNRLHYLRATLESARECLEYENVQWIVVDGGSLERGLQEYLDGLEGVEVSRIEGSLADSMNRIVELARGEFVMTLPDRMQFIVRGPWMHDLVELASRHSRVGNVNFDVQRRVTLARHFGDWYLPRVRLPCKKVRTRSKPASINSGLTS